MESVACEGTYSMLMEDDELSRRADPDVGYSVPPVAPVRVTLRSRGPGPYRLATFCLATLCVVLLVSIVAVAAHYKSKPQEGGSEQTLEVQKQEANVTSLTTALAKLRQEKAKLQRERDQLLAKLVAKLATAAPEVIKPATVAAGLSPVADTAPPIVCPEDWLLFNTSCYFVSRHSRDWPESQQFCQSKGGHLAIIHTAEEQTFVWESLPRGHWNAYWFGISDEDTEDEWKWVDGTPLVGGFWADGEPNNHIDEDCGYIVKTRKLERLAVKSWIDAPCSMYLPFICEREMEAAATNTTAAPL